MFLQSENVRIVGISELAAATALAEAETAGVLKQHPAIVARNRLLLGSLEDGQSPLLLLQYRSCGTLSRSPTPADTYRIGFVDARQD